MSIRIGLRTSSINHGRFAPFMCTACDERRWFHLVEFQSQSVVGDLLESDHARVWSLQCGMCNHLIDISAEDARRAMTLLPLSMERLADRIDEATFQAGLKSAGLDVVRVLENAEAEWTCPKCAESCPGSFSDCWNCGQARPLAPGEVEESPDVRTPSLDKALGRDGTDPYGGMKF